MWNYPLFPVTFVWTPVVRPSVRKPPDFLTLSEQAFGCRRFLFDNFVKRQRTSLAALFYPSQLQHHTPTSH